MALSGVSLRCRSSDAIGRSRHAISGHAQSRRAHCRCPVSRTTRLAIPAASFSRTRPSLPRASRNSRARVPLQWIEPVSPQPRRADRRCRCVHDPADHDTVGEHVVIVIVPLAGWEQSRGALEDQVAALVRHADLARARLCPRSSLASVNSARLSWRSSNILRRHMTPGQRAMVVAMIHPEAKHGGAGKIKFKN